MDCKEKAELTYNELQRRKASRLKGEKDAEQHSIENMYKVVKRARKR